jgi:hypothetical protein
MLGIICRVKYDSVGARVFTDSLGVNMPAGYEKIRDHFLEHKDPKTGKAMSLKDAKKHAAMIWNASHAGTGQTVGNGRKKK